MGLLDSIAGKAINSFLDDDSDGGSSATAMQMVMSLVQSYPGGLSGLLSKLTSSGLGEQVQSWVSGDDNQSIDAEQLTSSLGGDVISNLGQKFNLGSQETSSLLSKALPFIIDKITPDNDAGDEDKLQSGLSSLVGSLLK